MDTFTENRSAHSRQPKPKVYLSNIGCIENAQETARLREYFTSNGWAHSEIIEEADLIIVNTCAVNEKREADTLKTINRLNDLKKPEAKLWVMGCLAAINKDSLKDMLPDQVIAPANVSRLDNLLNAEVKETSVNAHYLIEGDTRSRLRWFNRVADLTQRIVSFGIPVPTSVKRVFDAFEHPNWYFVHTSRGCSHACAYCAIRFAKGTIKSRPIEVIREEVKSGIEKGHKDIVLTGDDLGSYGLDRGQNVADLLEDLLSISGKFRLRVRNLEPMGFLKVYDRIRELMRTNKITSLTVPLQTGSQDLLKSMKRYYSIEETLEALYQLKRINPDLLILTHILVGFPGESVQDFRATLNMIRRFPFDGIAPDLYTDRPGIASAQMSGKLPHREKFIRYLNTYWEIIFRVYLKSLGLWGGNSRIAYKNNDLARNPSLSN